MNRLNARRLILLVACTLMLSCAVTAGAENQDVYVLMNIPYAEFYAEEGTVTDGLDAVSSATLMKPRTGGLAGGSYHVDPEGSDITGVIFPVKVEDVSVLASLGGTEMTDSAHVEITVTNKGQESTTPYDGRDALFEAPSYSWYVLSETPVQFKTLTVADGKASFSAVNTEAEKVSASAKMVYDKHADQVIAIDGLTETMGDQQVSGIILIADDGTKVGLKHIANIWRGPKVGFNFDSAVYTALAGKTVVSVEVLTRDNHYSFETAVNVSADRRMAKLSDSYVELFPEFAREELKDYWMECIKAYPVDDETAGMYYTMLTQNYMGRLYGQKAIHAYSEDPDSMIFDCFFENGLAKLTVNGDMISGTDENGRELFRHTYAFVADIDISYFGESMPAGLHLYKTEDADAGIFTFFAFTDDDLATAQHIEYRYAASEEFIGNYTEGECAYWLASGIQDGYSEKLIKACIKLFVDENVGAQFAAQE